MTKEKLKFSLGSVRLQTALVLQVGRVRLEPLPGRLGELSIMFCTLLRKANKGVVVQKSVWKIVIGIIKAFEKYGCVLPELTVVNTVLKRLC